MGGHWVKKSMLKSVNRLEKELFETSFSISDKDEYLYRLAEEYHKGCESYDQYICTGDKDGVPMPANNNQFVMINKNAIRLWSEAVKKACIIGSGSSELKTALKLYRQNN